MWPVGTNLFSSWHGESEEDWREAWEKLKHYQTVDGFGDDATGAPLGGLLSLEDLLPSERSE